MSPLSSIDTKHNHLLLILITAIIVSLVHAQDAASVSSSFFQPLAALATPAPQTIGSANNTRCCLQALQDWESGDKAIFVQSSLNPGVNFTTPDQLAQSGEQFPCGATYQGDPLGAPEVFITYDWCASNCGGWQQSTNAVLTQWIQPFVGFILPAAVFCLNVPRKMILEIADDLFPNFSGEVVKDWRDFSKAMKRSKRSDRPLLSLFLVGGILYLLLKVLARLTIATVLGLANVAGWVLVVFATAAPMILSGLYEATIDRTVLRTIEGQVRSYKKSLRKEDKKSDTNTPENLRYQVHLLYAILVGNLQLKTTRNMDEESAHSDRKEQNEDEKDASAKDAKEASAGVDQIDRSIFDPEDAPAWVDVCELIRLTIPNKGDIRDTQKWNTRTRLTTMLACQSSFGATIGAPLAFFLGSFLFTIFGNFAILGDNDNSHALAFGEWWMTIPHVAIVAGCLLAGNNPNTLEAIYSGVQEDPTAPPTKSGKVPSIWQLIKGAYSTFYKSDYQPVWMWERGRNKRQWIKAVLKLWGKQQDDVDIALGFFSWTGLIFTAATLTTVPWVLAYVTSYYTPTIGLSCRTFTFVLYFIFQFGLAVVWAVDFYLSSQDPPSRRRAGLSMLLTVLAVFFFAGSAFTAIIGTFMQLLGVYRNCKCTIPMYAWASGHFTFVVSTNSAQQIYYAQLYWLGTGVASMVLLIIFCYLGWWYQRHWRGRYRSVVDDVLTIKPLTEPNKKLVARKERTAPAPDHAATVSTAAAEGQRTDTAPLSVADNGKKEASGVAVQSDNKAPTEKTQDGDDGVEPTSASVPAAAGVPKKTTVTTREVVEEDSIQPVE